jgi:hypothetical protein
MRRLKHDRETGLYIRRFGKCGYQVWFDGASASDYFETETAAGEEMDLLDAEHRLGAQKHGGGLARFRQYEEKETKRKDWKPLKRKHGEDPYNEGDEDL